MNIKRLEMMRVMMERVVAGSWEPVGFDLQSDLITRGIPDKQGVNINIQEMDLGSWAEYKRTPHADNNNTCGFSACAVGHACFDEEFRKLGWEWRHSLPTFNGKSDWNAVNAFFGLKKESTSYHLFSSSHYSLRDRQPYKDIPKKTREAKMVADRVQELITIGEDAFHVKYRSRA